MTTGGGKKPAKIPFNYPYVTGKEQDYILDAIERGHLSGNGFYTRKCSEWLERECGAARALLTNSCTAALEMAAVLVDVKAGDEVIMPSYTFVSTANAFVLRGATPVFVDIRPDTMNIDERLIEDAITKRTRAIVPVHYAGTACDMDAIMRLAARRKLRVIEDAAQGYGALYKGKPPGTIGDIGALSFHETKNVISGEGGALLLRDGEFAERAEIIWEKGTNRARFFRGEVDKYTWVDVGSSYLPSEMSAAFLLAQLEAAESITEARRSIWMRYHAAFEHLEEAGKLRRPVVPEYCEHNAHMYYVLMPDPAGRDRLLKHLRDRGIGAVFHYIPLHSAPAGRRFGKCSGPLEVTDSVSSRLLRLPLWPAMPDDTIDYIIDMVIAGTR